MTKQFSFEFLAGHHSRCDEWQSRILFVDASTRIDPHLAPDNPSSHRDKQVKLDPTLKMFSYMILWEEVSSRSFGSIQSKSLTSFFKSNVKKENVENF